MAAADVKREHKEVKAKFGVGTIHTKIWRSPLQTMWKCVYVQHDSDLNDVWLEQLNVTSDSG